MSGRGGQSRAARLKQHLGKEAEHCTLERGEQCLTARPVSAERERPQDEDPAGAEEASLSGAYIRGWVRLARGIDSSAKLASRGGRWGMKRDLRAQRAEQLVEARTAEREEV